MRNLKFAFFTKKKKTEEMLIKTKVPDQWHQMIIELLVK